MMFYNYPFDIIYGLSIERFQKCIDLCENLSHYDASRLFKDEIHLLLNYDVMKLNKYDRVYFYSTSYYEDMIKELFS